MRCESLFRRQTLGLEGHLFSTSATNCATNSKLTSISGNCIVHPKSDGEARNPLREQPLYNFYTSYCIFKVLLLLLLLYIIVYFIQGSHTHIPETNHVPRGYTVTDILSLLFMVPLSSSCVGSVVLLRVSTFRSMCAVPNMAVFCSSLLLLLLLLL